jgi:hypothetical protein
VSGAPTNSTPTPLHESAQVDRKDDITSRAQPPPRWSKQDAIKASSARLAQQIAMMQASQSSESVVLFGGLASTTIGCSTMAAQILQHEQALGSSIGREISDQAVASPSYFTPPPSMAASSCEACFGRGLDACDKENTELYRGRFPPCESCSHNGHDFCVAHVQRNDCLRYPVCLQCQVRGRSFCHWDSKYRSPHCERGPTTTQFNNAYTRMWRPYNTLYL